MNDDADGSGDRSLPYSTILFFVFLLGSTLGGFFLAGVSSWESNFGRTFAVLAFAGAASIAAGGLLGFLFGVPRKLQSDQARDRQLDKDDGEEQADSRSRYEGNTNLE